MTAPQLMTLEEVATFLRVPVRTLYSWRTTGRGPRAHRVGKHLRYRPSDVGAWLESNADAAQPAQAVANTA